MKITAIESTWEGCYDGQWRGIIVDDAFAHPAKFARTLIGRIYAHLLSAGYIAPGAVVVDPFGGVALGALDALVNGLHWRGCELEPKFVDLGNRNLSKWNRQFAHSAGWGTAKLAQGDSRRLGEVLGPTLAECCVSSPPYAQNRMDGGDVVMEKPARQGYDYNAGGDGVHAQYGTTPGQLGAMKSGDVSAVIGSPPYVAIDPAKNSGSVDLRKQWEGYMAAGGGSSFEGFCAHQAKHSEGYGQSPGNIANLPAGSVDSVVSSPPYAESLKGDGTAKETAAESHAKRSDPKQGGSLGQSQRHQGYGGPGNLGNLPAGSVADAVVSSPPYEGDVVKDRGGEKEVTRAASKGARPHQWGHNDGIWDGYGKTNGNLGNSTGETFWTAAAQIVAECYAILKPGGVAVWVCKDFVRNKKRVPFSDDWRRLCEACGFVTVEWIKASLVKETVEATLFNGNETKRRERKSFFRRLAEKKGSPRIDHEDVLVMRRP